MPLYVTNLDPLCAFIECFVNLAFLFLVGLSKRDWRMKLHMTAYSKPQIIEVQIYSYRKRAGSRMASRFLASVTYTLSNSISSSGPVGGANSSFNFIFGSSGAVAAGATAPDFDNDSDRSGNCGISCYYLCLQWCTVGPNYQKILLRKFYFWVLKVT